MENYNKKTDKLEQNLNDFLGDDKTKKQTCTGDECLLKSPDEIVERVEKVYKTTDGRQLLM